MKKCYLRCNPKLGYKACSMCKDDWHEICPFHMTQREFIRGYPIEYIKYNLKKLFKRGK